MKKFPVISENGNEYMVKVCEDRFFENHVSVFVYKRYKWRIFTWHKLLNAVISGQPRIYMLSKYGYDIIRVAKYEVKRMENEWHEDERINDAKNTAFENFAEWDGDCRDE